MSTAKIVSGLSDYMRRGLRSDASARICVGIIHTKADGTQSVGLALANHIEREDIVIFADALLRNVSDSIINGGHPECHACREQLKVIETARAALDVQAQPERAS